MPSEAQARITINRLLEESGWRFLPDAQGRRENIICEHRVSGRAFAPNVDLGADFERAPDGFVDYVLLNIDGRAVAVVEAKREGIDPLTGKEQARAYAERLGVSHIFLSNGLVHYYWNLRQGNPVKVSRFLPLEQLGKAAEWRPDAARLAAVTVDENYIAVSQDTAWLTYPASDRAAVMVNMKIRLLRDYQVEAMRALQKAASPAQHRFLFEMATGTGKTLLSAAIAKLYLRTENATRILFLVDRLELENQAWKNFNAYLANYGISTVIYKQKRRDWANAQVVVTTIQSLAARNRFLHEFAPTDFQLIISDEAHRTISGNNRAIFEYFTGAKLGLTATPRDYPRASTPPTHNTTRANTSADCCSIPIAPLAATTASRPSDTPCSTPFSTSRLIFAIPLRWMPARTSPRRCFRTRVTRLRCRQTRTGSSRSWCLGSALTSGSFSPMKPIRASSSASSTTSSATPSPANPARPSCLP